MRSSFLLIFISVCTPSIFNAQIINIESSRIQTDTTGWAGSVGSNFSIVKNTRKIITIGLEAHVQFKTEKDLWLLLSDYSFLKLGDEKFVSSSFAHLRYNRKVNPWLRWEAFTQIQANAITQIDYRFLVGTGPRFKILGLDKFRIYAASLIMYEHEKEKTTPVVTHNDIRNSSYVSFTIAPNNNFEIVSTTFYQPLLKNFNDARVYNQFTLNFRVSDHFGINTRWNYLYDSKPAGTAPKTNYNFLSGFTVNFGPQMHEGRR